ncbi:hypothetical protein [Brachybacterium sp. YJGR34]|uniref:hypothetical protein n=1 Tax=Brachybacterium sp. YJGR34 TaxID=2059911 RepID=UPI000E0AEBD5|nr:hypothetical protein [Brachybacterium sp. YJGR34]
MPQVIAALDEAARWAAEAAAGTRTWNPVYRSLAADPGPPVTSPPDPAVLDLVLRQLTAPALLVAAVTDGPRTRRLRCGLTPGSATLERSDGEELSQWSSIDVQDVPARITELLEEAGMDLAPPRLSIRRDTDARRFTPSQHRTVSAALGRGLSPEQAVAEVPDLDESLRDALTAGGPRLSLALTLHDPRRRVTEEPVTWSCLWVSGQRGLYRTDRPTRPGPGVHAVNGGDVLGTVLPVLEQGLRFAAACAASGSAQ